MACPGLHSKDLTKPLTISACYKLQPDRLHALEAWRILRSALAGKELDSRMISMIDFELRKLGGATDLTDEGQASSSEDAVSGSANTCVPPLEESIPAPAQTADHVNAAGSLEGAVSGSASTSDVGRPQARSLEHAVSGSANTHEHDEGAVDWTCAEDEGSEISAALVGELLGEGQEGKADEDGKAEEQRKKMLMLEFKKRGAGDVRWRALGVANRDAFIENFLKTMLSDVKEMGVSLWDTIWKPVLDDPSLKVADMSEKLLRESRSRHLQLLSLIHI